MGGDAILIISLEILLLNYFIKKVSKKIVNFKNMVYGVLFFQLLILILYRFELRSIGRVVYFSDAESYWDATLAMLNGNKFFSFNIGYVYYSYLLQKMSPFISVIWINISNLLLFFNTVVIISALMIDEDTNKKNIKIFAYTTLANPLISYSLFRNLKDAVFVFFVALTIYFAYKLNCKTNNFRKKSTYFVSLVTFTVILQSLRPWGFIIPVMMLSITLTHEKKLGFKKIIIILSLIPIGIYVLFYSRYSGNIMLWYPIVIDEARKQGKVVLIAAPFNMLIGPGPIRPMFGSQYFWFYTIVGNIVTSIGALFWWFILPFYLAIIKYKKMNEFSLLQKHMGSFLMIFVMIYSFAYGGSVELRFRGIAYIFFAAQVLSMYKVNFSTKVKLKYFIFLLLVFLGGIIFGI